MLNLVTSEGTQIPVEIDVISRSTLIRHMIEDLGESDQDVPVPNVTEPVMRKVWDTALRARGPSSNRSQVLEYCKYHRNDNPPPDDESDSKVELKPSQDAESWDKDYARMDMELLFDVMIAANYLDIKTLLDLGCKTVANMMAEKTPQEIRDLFGIPNDLTDEEVAAIKRENAWAQFE